MSRYAVFAYQCYNVAGGWNDLISLVPTLEEANAIYEAKMGKDVDNGWIEYGHIVDLQSGEIVRRND